MGADADPSPADDLTVDYTVTDEAVLITATGQVDMLTAPRLESAVFQALREPTHRLVIIDLTGVDFLSSAGVRALTLARREAQQGHQLRLVVGHQRAVIRSLELSGLDLVFALYKTVEDAIVDLPR